MVKVMMLVVISVIAWAQTGPSDFDKAMTLVRERAQCTARLSTAKPGSDLQSALDASSARAAELRSFVDSLKTPNTLAAQVPAEIRRAKKEKAALTKRISAARDTNDVDLALLIVENAQVTALIDHLVTLQASLEKAGQALVKAEIERAAAAAKLAEQLRKEEEIRRLQEEQSKLRERKAEIESLERAKRAEEEKKRAEAWAEYLREKENRRARLRAALVVGGSSYALDRSGVWPQRRSVCHDHDGTFESIVYRDDDGGYRVTVRNGVIISWWER